MYTSNKSLKRLKRLLEGKIQRNSKLFSFFQVREKNEDRKGYFSESTLSYRLVHEARKYEPREGEGGEENRGSYERSNVCKHLSCMW